MSRAKRLTGTPRWGGEKHRLGRRRFLPNKKKVYVIGSYIHMVPTPKQSKWYNIYRYACIVYTHYMATLGIYIIYNTRWFFIPDRIVIPATWVIKPRQNRSPKNPTPSKRSPFGSRRIAPRFGSLIFPLKDFLASKATRGKKNLCF